MSKLSMKMIEAAVAKAKASGALEDVVWLPADTAKAIEARKLDPQRSTERKTSTTPGE